MKKLNLSKNKVKKFQVKLAESFEWKKNEKHEITMNFESYPPKRRCVVQKTDTCTTAAHGERPWEMPTGVYLETDMLSR